MKKQLYIILTFLTFILLLLGLTVHAEQINIILKSPGDGAVITTYTQDFIFGFDQDPDVINCSLIVDNEIKKSRNTLIKRTSNKLTLELEAGKHDWFIKCVDTGFNEILSETRSLSVNIGGAVKEGYEIIYNANGLRSYVLTIEPGQSPVELPALKAGEDIQIKMGAKTHYLDIIKMGVSEDTNFVEVRDRTTGTIHRMLVPSTLSFDFDENKVIDVELSLKNVERNINAYFVVIPYPGTIVEEPEQEPEEEPEAVKEEPEEGEEPEIIKEPEEGREIIGGDKDEHGCLIAAGYTWCESKQKCLRTWEEECPEETPKEPEQGKKISTSLIVLIVILIIIIIIVIVFLALGRREKEGVVEVKVKKKEVKPKKKAVKKVVKKTPKKEKKEVEEKESPEPSEDWPILNEKFDIIKSTGRKMKK